MSIDDNLIPNLVHYHKDVQIISSLLRKLQYINKNIFPLIWFSNIKQSSGKTIQRQNTKFKSRFPCSAF